MTTKTEMDAKYFTTIGNELQYYLLVVDHYLSRLANNSHLENDVIVHKMQCMLNSCKQCKYCRANENHIDLICEQNAEFDTNSVNCRYCERTIKKGSFIQ